MLMTAIPVIASVGDAILAGQITSAGEQTVLKGCVDSQNLRVKNSGAGEAARFVTEPGVAPFKVNRKAKVDDLNADRVDGYSAKQLSPRAAHNSTTDAPDGDNFTLTTEITAPAPGILLISGAIDVADGASFNNYSCELEVDDEAVDGSFMISLLDGTGSVNDEEIYYWSGRCGRRDLHGRS